MTRSTGPSKGSIGATSMRITSSGLAISLAALLGLPAAAQGAAPAPASETDKPLSPVLEQAIVAKEKEVTAARREAIGLLEDYLHDSTRSSEQAESLYKLAE